jgi:TonB family protein
LALPLSLFAQNRDVISISAQAFRDYAVFHVEPEYPATARQFRMTGEVLVEVVVSPDGKVESVSVKKGSPLLATSVTAALKRWTFKPFRVDGRAVSVKSALTFEFRL